jgi:hypothetical protein
MQPSCRNCDTVDARSAGIPTWWPNEPADKVQVMDVRKVRDIFSLGDGVIRIRFTSRDWRIRNLPFRWEHELASARKRDSSHSTAEELINRFKSSMFQVAVVEDSIVAMRLREVATITSVSYKTIPIEREPRHGVDGLYGVWQPELSDHEYVFLRDCEKRESAGGGLSKEQKKRIASIRWRSKLRNLFTHPVRI